MQNFWNPFIPEDSWKNKARIESIKAIQQREADKKQKQVQEAIKELMKK